MAKSGMICKIIETALNELQFFSEAKCNVFTSLTRAPVGYSAKQNPLKGAYSAPPSSNSRSIDCRR